MEEIFVNDFHQLKVDFVSAVRNRFLHAIHADLRLHDLFEPLQQQALLVSFPLQPQEAAGMRQ